MKYIGVQKKITDVAKEFKVNIAYLEDFLVKNYEEGKDYAKTHFSMVIDSAREKEFIDNFKKKDIKTYYEAKKEY